MKFNKYNIWSFLLLLAGSMGFGSLYSALFNTVGREILPIFFALIVMPLVFMYAGFYSYNFLTFQKGKKTTAFVLILIAALLATAGIIGGKSDQQIFFSFHEILNLVSAWGGTIALGITLKTKNK